MQRNNTYPKSSRLRKRPDYLHLNVGAKKYAVEGLLLVWLPNVYKQPRLGVTVSKKVGNSVIRNKVKRYIREVFRLNRSWLPAVDINVIARREASVMDFHRIGQELEQAFRQIGSSACLHVARCS